MRYRHIQDEEPYFHRIAQILDLLETKKVHRVNGRNGYKVRCPGCGCKSGGFGIGEDLDTFILMCARKTECGYRENLNQLVNRLGDEEMKKEWWELSFGPRTSKKDPEWKGIQNRRTPGPKKQHKKTSDQDVPQMSERDLWRTAMSGGYIDPNHPLVRRLMRKTNQGDG
jgi:hypothetical protein